MWAHAVTAPRLTVIVALCCAPGGVSAHMPLAREVALSPQGRGLALRLPGFGWVVGDRQGGFAYLCDGLLDVPRQAEPTTPFVYRADGALLVGSQAGLRLVAPDGCPDGELDPALRELPIAALAAGGEPERVYAVTAESPPGVYRSDDGGQTFELRSRLPGGGAVLRVLLAASAEELFIGRQPVGALTIIERSLDGGQSFERIEHAGEIELLSVDPLLAMARDRDTRETVILHGEQLREGFEEVLRVRYFGGFASQPGGSVVWVGDEGGGVFRSNDGGLEFELALPRASVACLAHDGDALWACTPGLPTQSALARLDGAGELQGVVALADVEGMVECAAEHRVQEVCASAWAEWRVDVLGSQPPAGPGPDAEPAPQVEDASVPALETDGAPATEVEDRPEAQARPPSEPEGAPAAASRAAADCAIGVHSSPRITGALWLALLVLVLSGRRLRLSARRFGLQWLGMSPAPRGPASGRPPRGPDDRELIGGAQRGDIDAFAVIYDRHAPVLMAVAQRMLGDAGEAHDLLHDVFIEAWQAVRSYDAERGTVRTWLLVRVRSRALDRLARRTREDAAHVALRRARLTAAAPAPGEHPDQRVAVRRALLALDDSIRETLELRYYAGLTTLEIAQRMDVPLGTAKSRLARGLQKLEALLGELDEERNGR